MKLTLIKVLSLILACLMLCGALASCAEEVVETGTGTGTEGSTPTETEPQDTDTDTETETETETKTETETDTAKDTESETDTDKGDTDTDTETESETETVVVERETIPGIDYSPVELETRVDKAPEYEGYENMSKDYLQPSYILVEGEDYVASSINTTLGKYSTPQNASGGYVYYSGGIIPAEWKQPGFDIDNYDTTFEVIYEITVESSGYYKLVTSTGDRNHRDTTNFSVIIDGKEGIHCTSAKVQAQAPSVGGTLGELFEILDFGAVYLKRGEHRIIFRMDVADGYQDKPGGADVAYGRICFMMDYFSLSRVYSDNDSPVISYATDISKDPNASILEEAAKMNVFDASYPIQIDYVHFFEETGRGNYTITDYEGNVIYRRYFTGEENDIRKIQIGIKDHPTGYFKLQAGDYVEYYLVLPSLDSRTVVDSPFAMDVAVSQRVGNLERIKSFAAVYRMMGITWVRERLAWASYQTDRVYNKETGEYEYTYNESYLQKQKERYQLLKDAGLNVLLTFSTGAQWAKDLAINYHPNSQVTSGNYLGTYGTQLAIYEATNKIASELDGVIDIIELMNEPDHTFRDIAEHYSGWFKAAALGVIDSGSDMSISISGMCQPVAWRDFFQLMFGSDVMEYSSIYNFHSHADLPSDASIPDYGSAITMRNFPQALALNGVTAPVWISESGMKLPSETPTDEHKEKQAPYIVTSAVQALSYGIDKYFWFLGAYYLEAGGDYGSFSKNDRAYPVIASYAIATKVLGQGKYIGELKDLPENVRGYLFNTGERIVAVVWRTKGQSAYTFEADAPVLVTSMMGEQRLREPNAKGTISVNVSTDPIYITYTNPPTDYYAHSYDEPDEIVQPTVDFGDRVVITPEFPDFIFDTATKDGGHYIADGSIINVRVVNHNDVDVCGKVYVTIPGFTIEGLDTVVEVKAHDEAYIQLTLRKTGTELYDDHVTFTGKFWEAGKTEADGVETTPTAINVHATETKISRRVYYTLAGNLQEGKNVNPAILAATTVYVEGVMEGCTVKILINEEEFTNFTYTESVDAPSTEYGKAMTLTMDLSDLAPGKYMIYIGIYTPGGDLSVQGINVRYDGETVIFSTTR